MKKYILLTAAPLALLAACSGNEAETTADDATANTTTGMPADTMGTADGTTGTMDAGGAGTMGPDSSTGTKGATGTGGKSGTGQSRTGTSGTTNNNGGTTPPTSSSNQ